MTEPSADRTLSIQQAMAQVGVCRRTIYVWMAKGKLRVKRTAGGSVRIYESSLWQADGSKSVHRLAKPATPPSTS